MRNDYSMKFFGLKTEIWKEKSKNLKNDEQKSVTYGRHWRHHNQNYNPADNLINIWVAAVNGCVYSLRSAFSQHKNATHKKAPFIEEKLHCVLAFTEKVSLNQNFVTFEQ